MTSGSFEDRGEILSQGRHDPPRRSRRLVAAVAVVTLGTGAVALAVAEHDGDLPWQRTTTAVPVLAGGSVRLATLLDDRHRYEVNLFNPGPGTVEDVRVVSIAGRTTPVDADAAVDIAPHSWGTVAFSLPDECDSDALVLPHALTVRVGMARGGDAVHQVRLAEPGAAMLDNKRRECVAPTALDRRGLVGVWVLEESDGRWAALAGTSLMRFTDDGRYTFSSVVGRFTGHGPQRSRATHPLVEWTGTYHLRGDRLTLHGGAAQAGGVRDTSVWTTTPLDAGLLRLDVVLGAASRCHAAAGERLVFRRVPSHDQLAAPEPPIRR